jgi:competence protein ComEA helix-hairpin-helix repeat region
MSRADRFYLFITVFLVIAVIVGGVMLATKHSKSQPVEIVLAQTEPSQQSSEVYIGGAVANPGIYSLKEGDTLQALLSDAGIEPDADLSHIKIYIPREGEACLPQKVDLNRAEPWLLEALPGIGEGRAQAIIDYRNENGPFKRIEDLLQVKGIGEGTFDKIKDYITVSD